MDITIPLLLLYEWVKLRSGTIIYQVASAWRGWGWESTSWGWHTKCVWSGLGGGGGGKRKELINIEDVLISFIHVSICDRNKSSIFV